MNPHKKLFTNVIVEMSVTGAAELKISGCQSTGF